MIGTPKIEDGESRATEALKQGNGETRGGEDEGMTEK